MTLARYMRKGTTKFFWVTTIAALPAVTAVECNAGVDVTGQIADVTGFSFKNTPIKTPDMGTSFQSQIPGEDDAEDSSFTMYERKGGSDPIKTALAKGSVGNVLILFAGTAGATPAAGDKCDVWPATITSNVRQYTAANEAAKYMIGFALTAPPSQDVALS